MKKERFELRSKMTNLRVKFGAELFDDEIQKLASGKYPLPKKRPKGKPKVQTEPLLRYVWLEVKLQNKINNYRKDAEAFRLISKNGGFEFEQSIGGDEKTPKVKTVPQIKGWFLEAQKLYDANEPVVGLDAQLGDGGNVTYRSTIQEDWDARLDARFEGYMQSALRAHCGGVIED